ncbi:MAG: N(4)-(beta-N-acetylglucosaminyl)-L-asparaginase [Chloroflexales bacterium]|nr:N(4)-(beta-N-acetylglucosaminyl)-L-asparaginase [Chloroflexales bacterium]
MIIIASSNGDIGLKQGWDILKKGGTAIEAIEACTWPVEDNPLDNSVGYGGYPNVLGQVELDASIMDGKNLRAGCVGAIKGIRHPISVARKVMEELHHVMLVGEGAEMFAREKGFKTENLLSPEAEKTWRDGLAGKFGPEWANDGLANIKALISQASALATDPQKVAGTVNFIAIDGHGNMASAVSTSGWAWKYPGRLGDSPIIGAGNYCDNRFGGAACTGLGEIAIRCSLARTAVMNMRFGMSVEEAVHSAFVDMRTLDMPKDKVNMNMIALDAKGRHFAMSTNAKADYAYITDDMDAPALVPRMNFVA